MDIHKTLAQLRLAPYLDPKEARDNPWFAVMGADLRHLCEQVLDRPIDFAFNVESKPQAYAIYGHDLVVVSGGMFNTLCLIAEAVVEKGVYPQVGAANEPSWGPKVENHRCTVRQMVVDKMFSWARTRNKAWVSDSARLNLFVYLLRLLGRFVVLHELGHIWHEHGRRDHRRQCFELDEIDDGKSLSPDEATASQAREIVADRFAFFRLFEIQQRETRAKPVPLFIRDLTPGLLDTNRRRHDFLLQAIYLYFMVLDRENVEPDLSRLSHPPAAMRAVALYIEASQSGVLKMSKPSALRRAVALLTAADAIPAVLFGRFPNTALLRYRMTDFTRRYSELYPHFEKWHRAG